MLPQKIAFASIDLLARAFGSGQRWAFSCRMAGATA
jgi:hypothetical protein